MYAKLLTIFAPLVAVAAAAAGYMICNYFPPPLPVVPLLSTGHRPSGCGQRLYFVISRASAHTLRCYCT
uniref:Putative secreted protein n=1 Tax=Anopheles darlingi TaxID=43151 RepID=A0A2M4DHG2_ANODA